MLCRLKTFFFTLTDDMFWKMLLQGELFEISGHIWSESIWSEPSPSPDPEWNGLVEYNEEYCLNCGAKDKPRSWRKYWGV